MAPRKTTKATKRTSQLRKQPHSHIRQAKAPKLRKEVQELLGVTSSEEATRIADANRRAESNVVVNIDVDKLVGDVVERLKAETATPGHLPEPEEVINQHAPAASPVEAAMLDVINVSEETEKLVHELGVRLAPVLKQNSGDVVTLGRIGSQDTSVPLVDTLRERAGHITAINGVLLDLLDRLAT